MDVLRLQYFGNNLRFQIVWRVWGFINLVWEELLEAHARSAISSLSKVLWVIIEQWTVAPSHTYTEQYHEWIIEYTWDISCEEVANILDEHLKEVNGDYLDKRKVKWLQKPKIHFAPRWTFDEYHTSLGKVWWQTKNLVMSGNREYIEGVLEFIL